MTWPTSRMLAGLKSGWTDPEQARLVAEKRWTELPPLSQLSHPAIAICQGYDPAVNSGAYSIHLESTKRAGFTVVEARDKSVGPGWRTAIVKHEDEFWAAYADSHDAFHKSSPAQFKKHKTDMLPTKDDIDRRKYMLAHEEINADQRQWRADLVRATLSAFAEAFANAPTYSAKIMLPEPPSSLLKESLTVGAEVSFELLVPEGGASGTLFPLDDEMEIEIVLTLGPAMHITTPITDTIMSTVLPSIARNEDRWTRDATYSRFDDNLVAVAHLNSAEVEQLLYAAEVDGELSGGIPETAPSTLAHYVSASTIVDSVVYKAPMRSACGTWLVSSQDPTGMEVCPKCVDQLPDMSAMRDMLRQRIADGHFG